MPKGRDLPKGRNYGPLGIFLWRIPYYKKSYKFDKFPNFILLKLFYLTIEMIRKLRYNFFAGFRFPGPFIILRQAGAIGCASAMRLTYCLPRAFRGFESHLQMLLFSIGAAKWFWR